ncbi:MAG: 7-cyano-7-deazaguanine synthase QueC [Thermodesulfovibrionales bacterium]|nr:7-cyano-7-deazaguanine synthase QueC [Thermodesulfovibrionales bacterium]
MIGNKALVLLSGGIDSATTLAIAKSGGYEIYALSFDYSQRHARELESAQMVTSVFGVKQQLVIQFNLREIGGSALTSDIEVPKGRLKDKLSGSGASSIIPVTYVPARNTIFLSFALAWAEVLLAEHIFIGANAVDYSGYPDCRPEYLKAYEAMANLATKASVEKKIQFHIHAPLLRMKKSEIIKKGVELGLDYALTWSCYDPQPKKIGSEKLRVKRHGKQKSGPRTLPSGTVLVPCGRCDSCVFRAKGFQEAGMQDPLLRSFKDS